MNKRKDIQGVTLIEILVTLVIAGIVMAAIWEIYLSMQKQGLAQDEITEMQQNVRIATDQITKEFRLAGYSGAGGIIGIVGSNSINPIILDKDNTNKWVILRADFDESVAGIEAVGYKVSANSVLRRCYKTAIDTAVINPCQEADFEDFVPNITSLRFDFYNNQNAAVAVNDTVASSPVRRVSVAITAMTKQYDPSTPIGKLWSSSPNPASPTKYKTAQLTSDAVLRNFGTTATDTQAPVCPTDIAVTATGNCQELQVTWSWAGTDTDLGGFLVYYQASNGLDTGTLAVPDPNARSVFLQKRQNGVSYSVDVRAYDRYFNRNPTCDPLPYPTATPSNSGGAPNPPVNFQATPGNNQVTLSWNPIDTSIASNRDVKGYRLYRGTTSDFTPSSSNIIACERLKSGDAAVAGCINNLLSTADAEAGWSSVTSFVDATAANCTKYYYKIRSVDLCLLESSDSTTVNATPPDNDKAPNTPVITSLVAGDDTSSIIVSWALAYDPNDTTHSPPKIFRVFYKVTGTLTWAQWGADIPITLTGGVQTLTGSATLTGLSINTSYDIKISVFDDLVSMCGNESFDTSFISTAACAPKITWGTRGGHFIFPGITTTGQPLANFTPVGIGSGTVANSRFLTWIVDPLDCQPDSSNYDRLGFDYIYPSSTLSPNARVEFYINDLGSLVNTAANIPYNFTGITQFVDPTPRSGDGYYHWPVYPLTNNHIDTTRLCNGFKEFKIRAVDGEAYTAENSVILEIRNGGIENNSLQPGITNITTPDDFHNQVIFGLKNSSTVKDLRITKMQLIWDNFPAVVFLKKIEVGSLVVFEDTVTPIDTASGTEVTLTTVPTILIGSTATVKVTFTMSDGSVPSGSDMRGRFILLSSISFQDNIDPGFNCSSLFPTLFVTSLEPMIGTVLQDKPAPGTTALTTPDPNLIVAANTPVTVSLPVTDLSASVTSVNLQFAVATSSSSAAPTRPSNLTDLGNYPNLVTMTFDAVSGLWKGTIPANNNSRVWYFIEAQDSTGNLDISPNTGAYTYAQCGTTPPTLSFLDSNTSPTGPTPLPGSNINNIVTVEVSASSITGIGSVVLFTNPDDALKIPANAPINFSRVSQQGVSPEVWRGSYNASAGNLHHTINVKATDTCGNSTTILRTYN